MVLSRSFKNPSLIFAFLALVFLFSPAYAYAGFWEIITGPFTEAGEALAGIANLVKNFLVFVGLFFTGIPLVFAALIGVSYALMAILGLISAGIFAVIKPLIEATLSIPVVPGPETIPAVTEAWKFSQGIVSLFFVAILAFIGLATILRFKDYQLQKTLPSLLIIVLLINFSGVLVGFVVDMANLVTYSFIQPISVIDVLTGPIESQTRALLEKIMEIPTAIFNQEEDPVNFFLSTFLEPVIGALATSIFYLVFILVLLAVVFLFIIRIGILWILSILAPFAFAAYILPATREWWNRWWKSLIQWAFMGVPMAFFLLLAMKIASISIDLNISQEEFFGKLLITFIQPLFILLFLFVGFTLSISFFPGQVQSGVKKGTGWMKKQGTQLVDKGKVRITEKIAQNKGFQGFMKTQATTPGTGPVWALRRKLGQTLGPGMIEISKTNLGKTKDEAEKINTPDLLLSKYLSAKTDNERAAYLSTAVKKGKAFKKVFEGDEEKGVKSIFENPATKNQAIQAIKAMHGIGAIPDAERIARGFAHIPGIQGELKNMELGRDKLIKEAKGDDIKDFNKAIWGQEGVQDIIHEHWTGEKVGIAGREFHEDFLKPFQNEIDKSSPGDYLKKYEKNPRLHRYLQTSTANSLGVGFKEQQTKAGAVETIKKPKVTLPSDKEAREEMEKFKKEHQERRLDDKGRF